VGGTFRLSGLLPLTWKRSTLAVLSSRACCVRKIERSHSFVVNNFPPAESRPKTSEFWGCLRRFETAMSSRPKAAVRRYCCARNVSLPRVFLEALRPRSRLRIPGELRGQPLASVDCCRWSATGVHVRKKHISPSALKAFQYPPPGYCSLLC